MTAAGDSSSDVELQLFGALGYPSQMSDRVHRKIFDHFNHKVTQLRARYDEVLKLEGIEQQRRGPDLQRGIHQLIADHSAELRIWLNPPHTREDDEFAAQFSDRLKRIESALKEVLPANSAPACHDAFFYVWWGILGSYRDLCYIEDYLKPATVLDLLEHVRSGEKAIQRLERWLADFGSDGGDQFAASLLAVPRRPDDPDAEGSAKVPIDWFEQKAILQRQLSQFGDVMAHVRAVVEARKSGKQNRGAASVVTWFGRPAECLSRELLWLFSTAAWEVHGDRKWPEGRWRAFKAASADLASKARSPKPRMGEMSSDEKPRWGEAMGRYTKLHRRLFDLVGRQSPAMGHWDVESLRAVSPVAQSLIDEISALQPEDVTATEPK